MQTNKKPQCSKWYLCQIAGVGVQNIKKLKGSLIVLKKGKWIIGRKRFAFHTQCGYELMLAESITFW